MVFGECFFRGSFATVYCPASIECRKNKIKEDTLVTDNSRANQNWKQIPVNAVKRGKTRVAIGFGITMIG